MYAAPCTCRMHARVHARHRTHDIYAAFDMIAMSQDAHSNYLTRIATAKWSQIRRNWSIGGLISDLKGSLEWTLRGVRAYSARVMLPGNKR